MHTPTLAPRDGRATPTGGRPTTVQPGIPEGFRACTGCTEVFALEHFYPRRRGGEGARIWKCRACMRAYKIEWLQAQTQAQTVKRDARRYSLSKVFDLPIVVPIPESDVRLQLTIISACWLSCVEVGTDAIRRMMDRLVDATYLPGSITIEKRARLRNAVQSYRTGATTLDFVERTLRGVVGSGE